MNRPLVYDVGMNNGDDCEYYLAKGFRVIAIEANPELCSIASSRYHEEIKRNDLTIINMGVGSGTDILPFYVHKTNSVLSTFVPFSDRIGHAATLDESQYRTIEVETRKLSDIISFYGSPEYVKIDVEGFDAICLNDLRDRGIYPKYISAESHSIITACTLIAMGYKEFKLVEGHRVAGDYAKATIRRLDGTYRDFRFNHHSAGPFGEDILGEWVAPDVMMKTLLQLGGGGWIDVHGKR